MEDDAPKTGGTAGGPHGAGEAPYESGYSGSPEAADDSHGQIKNRRTYEDRERFCRKCRAAFHLPEKCPLPNAKKSRVYLSATPFLEVELVTGLPKIDINRWGSGFRNLFVSIEQTSFFWYNAVKGDTAMIEVNCEYKIKEDIGFIIEAEKINALELSEATKISRTTFNAIGKRGSATDEVCEKLYAYIYRHNYRINSVKEELIREKYGTVLFHGSKSGLSGITVSGSRNNCDFGNGFYLGQTYSQALSFVCEYDRASVYSFKYSLEGLKCEEFDCSLDWMIAICYFRGTIKKYARSEMVQKVVKKIEDADVIIAPIADNKMFYVMSQFAEGEINADVAIHSLSASRLGLQYIFKTDKALKNLIPIERYYLSVPEREDCRRALIERGYEIDTKLKLAKREFKTGLYIEELLK